MATGDYLIKLKGDGSSLNRTLGSAQSSFKRVKAAADNVFNGYNPSTDRASARTHNLARNANKLKASFTSLKGRVDSVKTSLNRVVTAMAGVGTTIVLFRTAAHSVVRFQKAMAEVRAITNANTQAFAMMSKEAETLGATTMFSAQQAAQGLKFLAMAGLSASEATKSLRATLNLAQAGAIDLGTAADIATNIMTAFRLNASQLTDVVDDIATTASRSNTSIQQLGDAMKYVSASAAAYGISLQESAAAIGVLSDAGMQASMAGTGFRQVLVRIAGQSAAMRQGMAALGITFAEINPEVHSLREILDRFAQTSITATQVSTMFGARAANAFNILLAGRDKLNSLTQEMENNNGRAQQMADIMGNSLFGALKKVQSAYEAFFNRLYESGSVATTITGALQSIADTINYLSGSLQVFQSAGDGFQDFGGKMNEAYEEAERFIEKITALGETILTVGAAIVGFKAFNFLKASLASMGALMAPLGAQFLRLGVSVTKTSVNVLNLALAGRKLRTTTAQTVPSLIKKDGILTKLRKTLGLSALATRGYLIQQKTLGINTVLLGQRINSLSTRFLGMRVGTRLASTALKGLSVSMGITAVAATVASIAVRKLARAINMLYGPLFIIISVIEVLTYLWETFISDGVDDTQKLTREVGRLEDEISQLQEAANSAELALDVKRNDDGTFTPTTDEMGQGIGANEPIKAFKDMTSVSDFGRLVGHVTKQLDASRDAADRLKKAYEEASEVGNEDLMADLTEQIIKNNEIMSALEKKKQFIEENGLAYIKEKNAVEQLQSATNKLSDLAKKYNTEAAAGSDTIQAKYQQQISVVAQLKREIEDLANAERRRAIQAVDAEIEAAKKEKTRREDEGDSAGAIRQERVILRAEEKKRELMYSGPVSGQIEDDPAARVGTQLNSQQQQALSSVKDRVQEIKIKLNADPSSSLELKEEIKEISKILTDVGITTIDMPNAVDPVTNKRLLEQISNTQELTAVNERLNIQKRIQAALEEQIKAEDANKSTDDIEKRITALQALLSIKEKEAKINKENAAYAKATAEGKTVAGAKINENAGATGRQLNQIAIRGSAMGEEDINLSGTNFQDNIPVLQEYFSKLQAQYSTGRQYNQAGIAARMEKRQGQMEKLSKKDQEDPEVQRRMAALKEEQATDRRMMEGVSGFHVGGGKTSGQDRRNAVNLFENVQKSFAGTSLMNDTFSFGEGDEKETKKLGDISKTDLDTLTPEARTKFEMELLNVSNAFINSMAQDLESMKFDQQRVKGAENRATSAQGDQLAKKAKQIVLAKQDADEEMRKLEIMNLQAQVADVLARKKDLVESSPDPDDKEGQAQYKQDMGALDLEEKELKGDIKVLESEGQAEKQSTSENIEELAKRITDAIREIRASDMTEDDKKKAIAELPEKEAAKVQQTAEEQGDIARANEVDKQDLKQAEAEKKVRDDRLKEEARVRKERANEAMKIAGKEKEAETTGQAGISSLAAIGGGGGVGVGGSIEDKQLEVQAQARDVLIQMLKVLQTPKEFEGKNDALKNMMGKLDNKELGVMMAGFKNLIEAAKNPNLNDEQRAGLKGQAQALLDGFGMKAAGRNFGAEGKPLPEGVDPKIPKGAGGANGANAGANPNANGNPIAVNAQPQITPMEAQTASIIANLSKQQTVLETIASNTRVIGQSIVINKGGGGMA